MAVRENKENRETKKGTICYDGLCIACSTEINHYRRLPGSEMFDFLDITLPTFKAEKHGIDPHKVHKVMHVKDPDGKMHEGVDAFIAIWTQIPRYHFAAHLAKKPWARSVLNLGYRGFVKIRPYLPRRKSDCASSPYCEVSHD